MCQLSLDEVSALRLVLNYMTVKDVLVNAMHNLAEQTDVHSQDNADVCFKAINTFLQ